MIPYVDLDGVEADFHGAYKLLTGRHPKFDKVTDEELWSVINRVPDFWENLPLMPGALELWRAVEPYSPVILTGCPKSDYENASRGKRLWVAKNLGANVPVITCLGRNKATFLTHESDVLIDDFIAHIRRWQKAGGKGILFKNAPQAIAEFEAYVESLTAA